MKFASTLAVASIILGANAIAVPGASADAAPAADLWTSSAKREVEAEARNQGEFVRPNFCSGFVGRVCPKKRDVPTEVVAREAEPWCEHVGQPCPKKREAEADARERWDFVWPNFCSGFVGRICGKAKRDASPEAEAVCSAAGQPCAKVRRAAEAFAAALNNPAADAWYSFCSDPRMTIRPCPEMTKRDAAAEAACYLPGAPCDLAKREAYALAAATADALPAAEAEAFYADVGLKLRAAFPDWEGLTEDVVGEEAQVDADAGFCHGVNGQIQTGAPCYKAKRAAEAVAEAIANPSADAWDSFCSGGRSCPKKREVVPEAEAQCFAAGGLCAAVKRSADALFEVAAGAQMKL